jgi:hypothetical protein
VAVGPRVCLGDEFSQVEFVAVIAMLLRSYRLKVLVIEKKMMMTEAQPKQVYLMLCMSALEAVNQRLVGCGGKGPVDHITACVFREHWRLAP